MKPARRALDLLIAFGAVCLIPALAAVIANLLRPVLEVIDPSHSFAWVSAHHFFQLMFTVMTMLLFGKPLREWGFNLTESRLSMRTFAWFCLIYVVPVWIINVLPSVRSGIPPRFAWPPTTKNIVGTLGFQFLLSGTCEEPLFRGFVMVLLGRSWEEKTHIGKVILPITGLWATLFFMIAHLNLRLTPFSVTGSISQEIWALGLGLFYAVLFARTRSLLGPILSHGYSNGVIFLFLYILAAMMK